MQDQSTLGRVASQPIAKKKADAEVLEWIGQAYGRVRAAHKNQKSQQRSQQRSQDAITLLKRRWTARRWIVTARAALPRQRLKLPALTWPRSRYYALAGVAVLVTVISALSFVQLPDVGTPTAETVLALNAAPAAVPAEPAAVVKTSEDRTALSEAAQAHEEAKALLAKEQEARNAAEARANQLAEDLSKQSQARDAADQANAKSNTELESERKARVDAERARSEADKARTAAEEAAKFAREALDRAASSAAPPAQAVLAPVTITSAPPVTLAAAAPEHAAAPAAPQALPPPDVHVVKASAAMPKFTGPAASVLSEGEKLFGKGDLEAARQSFARAAKMGSPEGALALGNTYDPVSLANAGVKEHGDPALAKKWYRKAHELAQLQRQVDQP